MSITKSKKVISLSLSKGRYSEMIDEIVDLSCSKISSYVCVANVHMAVMGFQDRSYASMVNKAELVTPDGMPLVWALKLLYGIKSERMAGMDLLPDLLSKAEKLQIPVYFYGGTNQMLNKTSYYLQSKHPELKIAGMYSPPFRFLKPEEEEKVIERINKSGAGLVFVILGCPKQEKWMAAMKGRINSVMIGIGGALPVMIGLQKRAPGWMQKKGLEWLYRLCQEPRRLFKRYAVTNSLFVFFLLREFVKVKMMKYEYSA